MDEIMRIGFDELFMWIARLYSMRSACLHYKVGVVFVKGNRIISAGYNGPARGEAHCNEVGCAKLGVGGKKLPAGSGLCRGAHAEINAVYNAAALGIAMEGTKIYCTYHPCYTCAKHLVNLGITEFVYERDYDGKEEVQRATELFMRRGILLRKFSIPDDVLKNMINLYLENHSTEEILTILGRPGLPLRVG